jgi:very-short-patch-repair endonuclease
MKKHTRHIIHYNQNLKKIAGKLRNESTLSEILLWNYLRGKKLHGYDFQRQKPIDNFIVDFFCNELLLAIEIDGSSHTDLDADEERQRKIEKKGIHFLRFRDLDVKNNIEGVLDMINEWIESYEVTHP